MKFRTLCLLLSLSAIAIGAVEVDFATGGSRLGYVVRDTETNSEPLFIPSAYEKAAEDSRDFAVNKIKAAAIFYNADHSAVVIEEANHRFLGNLFIVKAQPGKAPRLLFSTGNDLRVSSQTGLNWERYRYAFSKWKDTERLTLSLHGRYFTPKSRVIASATFEVDIDLHPDPAQATLREPEGSQP